MLIALLFLVAVLIASVLALLAIKFVRPRTPGSAAAGEVRLVTSPHAALADRARPTLPLLHALEQRQCCTCRHFDLAEGQAYIQNENPVFAAVSQILTPHEIGKAHAAPRSARWADYGSCTVHHSVLYGKQVPEDRFRQPKDPEKPPLCTDADCYEPADLIDLMLVKPEWRIDG